MTNITLSEALSRFILEELDMDVRVQDTRDLYHLMMTGDFSGRASSVVMQTLQWARVDTIDVTQELDVRQEATRVMAILQGATDGWRPGSLWTTPSEDGYAGWGYPLEEILYLFRDQIKKNLAASLDHISQIPRPGNQKPKAKWTLSTLPNGKWALAIGYDPLSVVHAHMVPKIFARVVGAGYIWFDEAELLLIDGDSSGLPTTIDTCTCLDVLGLDISDEPGLMIAGQVIANQLNHPVHLALNPYKHKKPAKQMQSPDQHGTKTSEVHGHTGTTAVPRQVYYEASITQQPHVSANLALKPKAIVAARPRSYSKALEKESDGFRLGPRRGSTTRIPSVSLGRAIHGVSAHKEFAPRARSLFHHPYFRGH